MTKPRGTAATKTESQTDVAAIRMLAEVAGRIGRYGDAEKAAQQSLDLEPNSDAHVNLGTIYFYGGRFKDASATFEKATVLAPSSHQAWVGLGDSYRWTPGMRERSIEPYEKAIAAAREALAVNPRDHSAQASMAIALAKLGRRDEAARASSAALKIDPTSQEALYAAAVVALARGTNDVALSWLERAVQAGYPAHLIDRDPELRPLHDKLKP